MKAIPVLNAALVLAVLAAVAGTSGCTRRDDSMGPAQKAGQAVDKAVTDANDKVAHELHDKLDKADQAAKDVARSAQETTQKINDATEDASQGLSRATEEVGRKVERAGEKIQESARK